MVRESGRRRQVDRARSQTDDEIHGTLGVDQRFGDPIRIVRPLPLRLADRATRGIRHADRRRALTRALENGANLSHRQRVVGVEHRSHDTGDVRRSHAGPRLLAESTTGNGRQHGRPRCHDVHGRSEVAVGGERVVAVEPEEVPGPALTALVGDTVVIGERGDRDGLGKRSREEGRCVGGVVARRGNRDPAVVDEITDRLVDRIDIRATHGVGARLAEAHVDDGRRSVGSEGRSVVDATQNLGGGRGSLCIERLDRHEGRLRRNAVDTGRTTR